MKTIKQNILANLPFLPDKVCFSRSTPQVVDLTSHFYDDNTGNYYNLTVEVIVTMHQPKGENEIKFFTIEAVYFTQNREMEPDFKFSLTELNDYIDF